MRGRAAGVVGRLGWRAFALPVLTAVTVAALVHDQAPAHPHPAAVAAPAPAAVHVEGTAAAGFEPAATPAPRVVSLGDDATTCASNTGGQLVIVSIGQQRLWACDGHKQVETTPVTTGATAVGNQTPTGTWTVQSRQRDRYLVGAGYRDYVQFWVPFDGDIGFHDASWQTMPFGSKAYVAQGSHGCVHLPTADMAWLYNWVTVGDTDVTVQS